MTDTETFRAYRVEREGERYSGRVVRLEPSSLPPGDVRGTVDVQVAYSSLNYKDALSATGNPGVTKAYPHTPGIDAAGIVTDSQDERFAPGDAVIVTSYDLGMNTPGGFGERVRVPADWALPLPPGLSLREAMILGTAGFTAALAVNALLRQGLQPGPESGSASGPVVVTGASGGVGSVAVALLAKLGLEVFASTGSDSAHAMLRSLGASRILPRRELAEPNERPLLKGVYGGAVDTVGGVTLANVLKSLEPRASVAACGLVGGAELPTSVYPFILRGVNLLGVDSQNCPMPLRREVWARLGGEWKLELDAITREIELDELGDAVAAILAGQTQGRVLVKVGG